MKALSWRAVSESFEKFQATISRFLFALVLAWHCWLGGATWVSTKQDTIVACYILVVK